MSATALPSTASSEYTRLHITPLDPGLIDIVLPTTVRSDARNISYHGIQTFPEKRYGFVELPRTAAEKLRKKLNGAVLKGVKLRVEPARSKKEDGFWAFRKEDEDDDMPKPQKDEAAEQAKRPKSRTKHSSRRQGGATTLEEIPGIQLEPGRQVKRGWTEGPDERKARKKAKKERGDKTLQKPRQAESKQRRKAAKYSDKNECLMKTVLPPKAAAAAAAAAAAGTKLTAGPSAGTDDDETKTRKRKRDKKARQVVVHEFEHSTKFPTFLKSTAASSGSRANLEYVDGKGWVNEEGEVVEALQTSRPAAVSAKIETVAMRAKLAKVRAQEGEDEGESSETSDSGSDSESESDSEGDEGAKQADHEERSALESSASDSSSDESDEEQTQPTIDRPRSSGSTKGLTIKIPPPPTSTKTAMKPADQVHPLEALYKKPKANGNSEAKTGGEAFSFFGAGDEEEEEEEDREDKSGKEDQPPMTPYTKQELEWRHVRSAAPTPDTAHPSRMGQIQWPLSRVEDEDEEEEERSGSPSKRVREESTGEEATAKDDPTGNFENWFWDNRGDLNRSWKKRRKTAAKEKRYRENRTRAGRAI